eukprot:1196052-Prorocentrum_minimum.AAC.4
MEAGTILSRKPAKEILQQERQTFGNTDHGSTDGLVAYTPSGVHSIASHARPCPFSITCQ